MKKLYFIILVCIGLITNGQNIYTIAGNNQSGNGGDGSLATSAQLNAPTDGIAMDAAGNIYIADHQNSRIRKIDVSTGIITTIAGTGNGGYNGDTLLATSADLYYPQAIALDKAGNVFIADYSNQQIRKVDVSSGLIYTVVGTGVYGYNGDTILATSAQITNPYGIALDTSGNIYFSETGARIRKVDVATGLIYTIAGTGVSGYNGNNIPAITAQLGIPCGLAVDFSGNVFFADRNNKRVRKIIASTGLLVTVAGNNGTTGFVVDGIPAINAELSDPQGVALDLSGNLFIADAVEQRIRKVNTSGIIITVAGNGGAIFAGDGGPATSAGFNTLRGVYVDKYDNIYITDSYDNRIREVVANHISTTLVNVTCNGACNGIVNASTFGGKAPYSYSWNGGLGAGAGHSNVCAGNYVIAATDADGHVQNSAIAITQPTSITITVTTTDATCGGNGSASSIVAGGTAPYSYSWPGAGTYSLTTGLSVGNYSLTVTDTNNCVAAKPFTISFNPSLFIPVPICMVTVDTNSQNNIILWDKTPYTNVDSFIVYREISTNTYNRIGAVSFDSLSEFTDTVRALYFPNTGNPNSGTYRYKLQARDTCGNYTQLSPFHNTIYIIDNGNGTFYWTQLYTIEGGANPVNNYVLMRDDNSTGNWQPVTSVAGTQQTVNDPLYSIFQSTASWRVQTQWGINCTPTFRTANNFGTSFSNSCTNNPNTIKINSSNINLNIYPNPSNGKFVLEYSSLEKDKTKSLEVVNMIGKKMYSQNDLPTNQTIIDLSSLSSGVYFLNLKTEGNTIVKKIVIQ